jgi:hypothetical protein
MIALALEQKNFKWGHYFCTKCNSKLWSHGFVTRCFSNFNIPIYFKRFRCASCEIIFTLRPDTYWSRVQSSVENVFQTIEYKFKYRNWPDEFRQRYNYWNNKFISYKAMHFQSLNFIDAIQLLVETKQSFFT